MAVRTAYSIGFTKHSAEEFFESLRRAGIRRLIDVRLNNVSQLAGFTKRDDLAYFVKAICGAEYVHEPQLAPTAELLGAYRSRALDWNGYERGFLSLMRERRIEEAYEPAFFDVAVLLCSEPTAEKCHRRLVLEYLKGVWTEFDIEHL